MKKSHFFKKWHSVYILLGILLCVALVSTALFVWLRSHDSVPPTPLPESDIVRIAPEISLPNAKGEMIALAELQAPVRIIYFWASWSPYTKDDMRAYSAIQTEFEGDIEVFAVNRDRNKREGESTLKDLQLTERMKVVYDDNDSYFEMLKGFGVPETVFIDKDRTIIHRVHGPIQEDELRAVVESILASQ
jgi:thiol-disulfide isomerase/thioredoxin